MLERLSICKNSYTPYELYIEKSKVTCHITRQAIYTP